MARQLLVGTLVLLLVISVLFNFKHMVQIHDSDGGAGASPGNVGGPIEGIDYHTHVQGDGVNGQGLHVEDLFVEGRGVLHVATDKPTYRPGETVYIRGVAVSSRSMLQMVNHPGYGLYIKVKNGLGSVVHETYEVNGERGVFAAQWVIPKHQAGGEFSIYMQDQERASFGLRNITIRAYRPSTHRTQLALDKDSYAAGDTVIATATVQRAGGGIMSDATASFTCTIDGLAVASQQQVVVPSTGLVRWEFTLPVEVGTSGAVSVRIVDGADVVSATATLPLVETRLDVTVFPESGDLVANVPTRVYVEASLPSGVPADMEASLLDTTGLRPAVVGSITTKHEGRGVSTVFTPAMGHTYELRVTKPASVHVAVPLPVVHHSGVCMRPTNLVTMSGRPLELQVAVSHAAPYRLSVFRRETELASVIHRFADAGTVETLQLTLPLGSNADGVLRVTAFNSSGYAVAERLVFRAPTPFHVQLSTDRTSYAPGDTVQLTVKTTTSTGAPVPATVGLTVTDDAVLQAVEVRRQHPRLPAMALLEQEVSSFWDSAVFIKDLFPQCLLPSAAASLAARPTAQEVTSSLAIDLLLGTQGWRRFAYTTPSAFFKRSTDTSEYHGQRAEQLFAVRSAPQQPPMAFAAAGGVAMNRARFKAFNVEGRPQPMFMRGGPVPAMHAPMAPMDGAQMVAGAAVEPMVFEEAAPVVFEDEAAPQAVPTGAPMEAAAAEDAAAAGVGDMEFAPDMPPPAAPAFAAEAKIEIMPMPMPVPMPPMDADMRWRPVVREYAHTNRAGRHANDRIDFAETVFWAAGVSTDATGSTTVSFTLSDAVTTFAVVADATSTALPLGCGAAEIVSELPLAVDIKLPSFLLAGDQVAAVVTTKVAALRTPKADAGVRLAVIPSIEGPLALLPTAKNLLEWTQARESARVLLDIMAGTAKATSGVAQISLLATATGSLLATAVVDRVTRETTVLPRGFPQTARVAGSLAAAIEGKLRLQLPIDTVSGSLLVAAKAYPSPVGKLTDALKALIQRPCGCFEQTSSTSYPLVMAARYFATHSGVPTDVVEETRRLLLEGYQKLTSFESPGGGFEWFGAAPGHEALTAYGLMQFQEMAQVLSVDPAMLERTTSWLLARRDGHGRFQRNPKSLDSFGRAPDYVTDAYIVWALTSARVQGLDKELNALYDLLTTKPDVAGDAYFVGLLAASLYNVNDAARAKPLAAKLAALQQESGSVVDALTTITCSAGEARAVEVTSIAALAWMNDEAQFGGNVVTAMQWLATQCQNGRFSSTQATVLALKAIITYDQKRSTNIGTGAITLLLDDLEIDTLTFEGGETQPMQFDTRKLTNYLVPGGRAVELRLKLTRHSVPDVSIPYSLQATYNTPSPATSAGCAVALTTQLMPDRLPEGSAGVLRVVLKHAAEKPAGMVLAEIGVPGGLTVRSTKLAELREAGTIAAYEFRNATVVLYWRGMAPSQSVQVDLDVTADVPGLFYGSASKAYLYYTDELVAWAPELSVQIAPDTSAVVSPA